MERRARSADDYWGDFNIRFWGTVCLKGESEGLVDVVDVGDDVLYVSIGGVFTFDEMKNEMKYIPYKRVG